MKVYNTKKAKVVCKTCGSTFEKLVKEINRSLKLGREQYCSRSCSKNIESNLLMLSSVRNRDTSHLDPANRKDEYSDFREYLRRSRRREKECTITLDDLKLKWDSQGGLCAYTNVPLSHPTPGTNSHIFTASLDRKDSSIGYTKDNIQFISIAMNHMKSSMEHEEVEKLLGIIRGE